jgi:hypothetical protein
MENKAKLTNHMSFVRLWIASTISIFGTYITSLALQVLVVVLLWELRVLLKWDIDNPSHPCNFVVRVLTNAQR